MPAGALAIATHAGKVASGALAAENGTALAAPRAALKDGAESRCGPARGAPPACPPACPPAQLTRRALRCAGRPRCAAALPRWTRG